MRQFPDEVVAEALFVQNRWPDSECCPECGSAKVQTSCKHKRMPFRCQDKAGGKKFSVKTNSVMEGSKIGYQNWILAMSMVSTSLKGLSSMKLHCDLEITQKTAGFLSMRIRRALAEGGNADTLSKGPTEVDESYFGGKRRKMSNTKRKQLEGAGRGAVDKTAVVGTKDRATNQEQANVVRPTDADTRQGFVDDHADSSATVYTDDSRAYGSLKLDSDSVKHSLSEYVKGDVQTNGMESLCSILKRAHRGTYHKFSPKHWTATFRSSLDGTTSENWIPSDRCILCAAEWTATGCATER